MKPPVRSVEERNALVMANQGLAHFWARKLYARRPLLRRNHGLDDVVQIAEVALIKAAAHWDSGLSSKFTTYASRSIESLVSRLTHEENLIRVPQWMIQVLLGNTPQQRYKRDERDGNRYLEHARRALGYERQTPALAWDLREEEPDRWELLRAEQFELLHDAMARLGREDHWLLTNRYGFGGEKPKTLRQLAAGFGKTSECIRLRLRTAHWRLRKMLGEEVAHADAQSLEAAPGVLPPPSLDRQNGRRASQRSLDRCGNPIPVPADAGAAGPAAPVRPARVHRGGRRPKAA